MAKRKCGKNRHAQHRPRNKYNKQNNQIKKNIQSMGQAIKLGIHNAIKQGEDTYIYVIPRSITNIFDNVDRMYIEIQYALSSLAFLDIRYQINEPLGNINAYSITFDLQKAKKRGMA